MQKFQVVTRCPPKVPLLRASVPCEGLQEVLSTLNAKGPIEPALDCGTVSVTGILFSVRSQVTSLTTDNLLQESFYFPRNYRYTVRRPRLFEQRAGARAEAHALWEREAAGSGSLGAASSESAAGRILLRGCGCSVGRGFGRRAVVRSTGRVDGFGWM